MPILATSDMLTIAQAAEQLNVHKNTVRNLIKRGELEAVRYGRNLIRIPSASLESLGTPYVGGEYGVWSR